MKDDIMRILDRHDGNVTDAAVDIYKSRNLALYVIAIGLEHLKARTRALRRREIRHDIGLTPSNESRTSFGLSERNKAKLFANTKKLFGSDGWKIGELDIQSFTREMLLIEANRERKLARGHIVNAQIYETLAEPMKAGQRVSDFYTPRQIAKITKTVRESSTLSNPA